MTDLTPPLTKVKWLIVALIATLSGSDGAVLKGEGGNDILVRTHPHSSYYRDNSYYYYNPTSTTQFPIARQKKKCNGEDNLKEDLAILSFKLGLISSVAGLFSLTEFSVVSNNISIISTVVSLILWVPSAVLTFFAWSDPISWTTGNLVNVGSLLITLYGGAGIFFGTADIIVSTLDEVLGITSLILSALTTYPEMYEELKELLQEIFGVKVINRIIDNYGCSNDYRFVQKVVAGKL